MPSKLDLVKQASGARRRLWWASDMAWGQKNQVAFIAFIALFFLVFSGLSVVSKHLVNPNPLLHKDLWFNLPFIYSFLENHEIKAMGNYSEVKTLLGSNPDDQNTNTGDNLDIFNKYVNERKPTEPPSVGPSFEGTAIHNGNEEEKGHLDADQETHFENDSQEVLSELEEGAEGYKNQSTVVGIKMSEKKEKISKPSNVIGVKVQKNEQIVKNKCNIFSGRWVEEASYPLYQPGSCPYVDEAFNCQDNGRPDSDFLKWRWQPHDCELPSSASSIASSNSNLPPNMISRFNATDFLERLRGKRLMLVGDSMNRNQYESMLCLLREALSDKSKMFETRGYRITKGRGYYIFKFTDYNCTVEFCRSHFLVREGKKVRPTGKTRPTLMIDRIDKTAPRWKRAHILIFNTGHWWTHGKTAKGKDYYQEGGVVYERMDVHTAFRRAMTTWGKWIDENLNPAKTHVFYRGYSAAHFSKMALEYRGGQWNSGGRCTGETQPIFNETFLGSYPAKMQIVEDVIQQMQTPITLLNVTRLTEFRKDGHPSVYGKHFTELEQRKLTKYQDCSHWCLPGIPDAWNELIYASLVMEMKWNKKSGPDEKTLLE
eukprot:Gb_20341 [translate_table: standard]